MKVLFMPLHNEVNIPQYATDGSAGFDLVVDNFKTVYNQSPDPAQEGKTVAEGEKSVFLTPHSRMLVGCGFCVKIPAQTQLEIRSRSGKALKEGLVVLNSPGTIDEDYTGEIGAILCNTSEFVLEVKKGDKIAQAVLVPYLTVKFEVVSELPYTARGSGGFGHTDKK